MGGGRLGERKKTENILTYKRSLYTYSEVSSLGAAKAKTAEWIIFRSVMDELNTVRYSKVAKSLTADLLPYLIHRLGLPAHEWRSVWRGAAWLNG